MGIRQRDAGAEFPHGRRRACGFAYEYHVGGGLEVGTGAAVGCGFHPRAGVQGISMGRGVPRHVGEGKLGGMCSIQVVLWIMQRDLVLV